MERVVIVGKRHGEVKIFHVNRTMEASSAPRRTSFLHVLCVHLPQPLCLAQRCPSAQQSAKRPMTFNSLKPSKNLSVR